VHLENATVQPDPLLAVERMGARHPSSSLMAITVASMKGQVTASNTRLAVRSMSRLVKRDIADSENPSENTSQPG